MATKYHPFRSAGARQEVSTYVTLVNTKQWLLYESVAPLIVIGFVAIIELMSKGSVYNSLGSGALVLFSTMLICGVFLEIDSASDFIKERVDGSKDFTNIRHCTIFFILFLGCAYLISVVASFVGGTTPSPGVNTGTQAMIMSRLREWLLNLDSDILTGLLVCISAILFGTLSHLIIVRRMHEMVAESMSP